MKQHSGARVRDWMLLKDGAEGLGCLLKERVADVDELPRALEEVSRGGSVLDPKVVESLVARRNREARSPLAQLTERRSQLAASVSTSCILAPACDAFRLGNSATFPASGMGKPGVARSLENVSFIPDGDRSILITSPRPI